MNQFTEEANDDSLWRLTAPTQQVCVWLTGASVGRDCNTPEEFAHTFAYICFVCLLLSHLVA